MLPEKTKDPGYLQVFQRFLPAAGAHLLFARVKSPVELVMQSFYVVYSNFNDEHQKSGSIETRCHLDISCSEKCC